MSDLSALYSVKEIEQLEQLYARFHDGQTYSLMERAGAAVYTEMRERWPDLTSILVVCGKGNNGGDGFVVARLAAQAGLKATVALLPGAESPVGDAERAYLRLKNTAALIKPWHPELLNTSEIIVDAMLGTGVKGVLREPLAEIIQCLEQSKQPIVAVDVPSGLNADTGAFAGSALSANLTICFIGLKRGLVTGRAADVCGEVIVNDLKCGSGVFALIRHRATRFSYDQGAQLLRPRLPSSHKGHHGHVLVIGGFRGYSGAVRLCAEGAARVGAGKVSVLTHPQHADMLGLNRPEIMCHAAEESASMESLAYLLKLADVIVIGPGLSKLNWGRKMVAILEDFLRHQPSLPTVWDADALNILSERPRKLKHRIMTPHPGEASRLLEMTSREVQQERYRVNEQLVEKYDGISLLKGYGSLVGDGTQTYVIDEGNAGMATAGMGDVLSGIIGGLIAQGLTLIDAARLGAALHGRAAELAVNQTGKRLERGLLAGDLMPFIYQLANPEPR